LIRELRLAKRIVPDAHAFSLSRHGKEVIICDYGLYDRTLRLLA
jgi:hypothetical protein